MEVYWIAPDEAEVTSSNKNMNVFCKWRCWVLLQVWFNNVPHTRLVEDKGGQNWITRVKDKFKFPGGGTQFIHGADEYLDHINKVIIFLKFWDGIQELGIVSCF